MKKFIKGLVASAMCLTFTSTIVSCEDEVLGIGSGLVGGDAQGDVTTLDVIAYNTRFDSLRSDQRVLQNALLGVYEEPVFGKTKASLVSQIRANILSPSFGKNPTVDSVHLFIPVYNTADTLKADTVNITNPGVKPTATDAIRIKKLYQVDSIYGNKNATMRLNVREIEDVLYLDSAYYSKSTLGRPIQVNPTVIGSGEIGKSFVNVKVNNPEDETKSYEEPIGYKISLDKTFFQNKIVANEKTGLLNDHATFIRRVIKGLHLSVEDESKFLVAINPNQMTIKMYYSSEPETTSTTTTTEPVRTTKAYSFNFSNQWTSNTTAYNVQVSQLDHSNFGSAFRNSFENPDKVNGASRLYLNGADNTRVNVKLIQDQINELKNKRESENWTIIGAKLKFFIDESHELPKPGFIMAWNQYKKDGKEKNVMFADITDFYNSYPYSVHFNPLVEDENYYTLDITKHIKELVEKGVEYEDQEMIVTMGNFLMSSTDTSTIYSANPMYRNTVANPYRIVLHGNATDDSDKKLKLLVYYTKK